MHEKKEKGGIQKGIQGMDMSRICALNFLSKDGAMTESVCICTLNLRQGWCRDKTLIVTPKRQLEQGPEMMCTKNLWRG
jgi:hypothetical protein